MNRSASDVHARTNAQVIGTMAAAMRADNAAIQAAVDEVILRGRLDAHTAEFLRQARTSVLGVCAALTGVLQTHRCVTDPYGAEVCVSCGTAEVCWTVQHVNDSLLAYSTCRVSEIDRAEAWRRADAWINRDTANPVQVAVEEFPDGFVIWPVSESRPTGEKTLLIVDKRTGRLTRWPPLPKDVLAVQYRNYLHGRPIELGPSEGRR
ncbi:hypothetical protein [Actinoallomurus sp. NPDC052274]|uniref:hypothetical protein n=1 Tax=Actinoallomurus sp. NPDC052274 TaxID=3155420 RepID=UPI00342BEDE5